MIMFHRFPSDLSANKGVVLPVECNKFNDDHSPDTACCGKHGHSILRGAKLLIN